VLNDVVGNIRDATGFGGWLLHLAGFAGNEAHVPAVVKMAGIEDTKALRTQLLLWSEMDTLVRILVSHGSPIDENPRQVLRELAESLT
jgi:transcriptional regulator